MTEHTIYFDDAAEASALHGDNPQTLQRVEEAFRVQITARDTWMKIQGEEDPAVRTIAFFDFLRRLRQRGENLNDRTIDYTLDVFCSQQEAELESLVDLRLNVSPHRRPVAPKTLGQARYLQGIQNHDVTFGIGPAGTGKTYLAMATAIHALIRGEVSRVILTRPAIEAGEALGFLPGDLQQKILPYLRPLYDALYDMMDAEEIKKHIDQGIIEVAPLAYMRGRTLNQAFVILDEAQNTTPQQMFMFLTRLGQEARAVVTGDLTQVDLPSGKPSGLAEARRLLASVNGLHFHEFEPSDVVRHPLVGRIISAWDKGAS